MLRLSHKVLLRNPGQAFRHLSLLPATEQQQSDSAPQVQDESAPAAHTFPIPRSDPRLGMDTNRRLPGSPTLSLEAVALPHPVQSAVNKLISASDLPTRELRKKAIPFLKLRAQETYRDKRVPLKGAPLVLPPPQYTNEDVAAYAATRMPGTYTATAYALAEVRRALPAFAPQSVLDFGAGLGTGTLAMAAAFGDAAFSQHARVPKPTGPIQHVCLVDPSKTMRAAAPQVLDADPALPDSLHLQIFSGLHEAAFREFDVVLMSHTLSEIVRATMAAAPDEKPQGEPKSAVLERGAERRLRKILKQVWRRVAPGGVMVIVEDGTAAGFESVLFARETLLHATAPPADTDAGQVDPGCNNNGGGGSGRTASPQDEARVVAPCMHSSTCPLDGSVTRKRMCRFVQRLNRPPFQRTVDPRHDGFEDEYLSYVALQRVPADADTDAEVRRYVSRRDDRWGRLVRSPLLRGKHVAIDACTNDGKLERRVVTKKNAPDGYYHRARKSKWGDIWPTVPASNVAPVNF